MKELAREHTGEAIQALVSIMLNPKSALATRVSAANSLLDRGYGKPPQHVAGEGGPQYVVRLPQVCATAEEWVATLGIGPLNCGIAVADSVRSPVTSTRPGLLRVPCA